MKSRNIVVMIQIKTEKDIILLQDKDFWDNMNTVRDAPVIFKVKYIPYEMATVIYGSTPSKNVHGNSRRNKCLF